MVEFLLVYVVVLTGGTQQMPRARLVISGQSLGFVMSLGPVRQLPYGVKLCPTETIGCQNLGDLIQHLCTPNSLHLDDPISAHSIDGYCATLRIKISRA